MKRSILGNPNLMNTLLSDISSSTPKQNLKIKKGVEEKKFSLFSYVLMAYGLITILNLAIPFLLVRYAPTLLTEVSQRIIEDYMNTFSIPLQGLNSLVSFMVGYYFKESQK